jgi:hypothetical protein
MSAMDMSFLASEPRYLAETHEALRMAKGEPIDIESEKKLPDWARRQLEDYRMRDSWLTKDEQ